MSVTVNVLATSSPLPSLAVSKRCETAADVVPSSTPLLVVGCDVREMDEAVIVLTYTLSLVIIVLRY